MTKQDTDKQPAQERQRAPEEATAAAAATQKAQKRMRPVAGFIIAGASLALLFGIAALKGRVKDDT